MVKLPWKVLVKKTLSAAIVFGLAAALVLAGASPATAAAPEALPPAQALYAIDCDIYGPQLWSVGADGASTPVGNHEITSSENSCSGGAQTNPIDGLTYFIYFPGGPLTTLARVDLTTGVVVPIGAVSVNSSYAWQLFITNSGDAFLFDRQVLYSLSLTDRVITAVGTMAPESLRAVGYDSTTDTIYGFDYSNTIGVYTIDRTTGEATKTDLSGTWPTADCLDGTREAALPNNVAFDSAGIAWIQSDSCNASIMTVNVATGEAAMRGELNDPSELLYSSATNSFYSQTFIIGPAAVVPAAEAPAAPALAATGFNSGAIAVAGGIGAIATVLGAALMLHMRRTT